MVGFEWCPSMQGKDVTCCGSSRLNFQPLKFFSPLASLQDFVVRYSIKKAGSGQSNKFKRVCLARLHRPKRVCTGPESGQGGFTGRLGVNKECCATLAHLRAVRLLQTFMQTCICYDGLTSLFWGCYPSGLYCDD